MAQDLPIVVMMMNTMKIIVPVYNQRLSPVFDWCTHAVLVNFLSGKEVNREQIELSVLSGLERVEILIESGAEVILCGGISLQLEGVMIIRGINVISWLTGNVEEILIQYSKGEFKQERWLMPGVQRVRTKNNQVERKNSRLMNKFEYWSS